MRKRSEHFVANTDMDDGATTGENALCVDSSVLVGFSVTDELDERVDRFMDSVNEKGTFIYAPSIVQFEVARAMFRKETTGRMPAGDIDERMAAFFTLPVLLIWNQDIVTKSVELCRRGFTNLYDAAFVSVALIKNIPLVTGDKEMLKRARLAHCRAYTVGEWLEERG